MQKPIPETVLYRMFLRHVAAFDKQAQTNPAIAEPLRNHILHKYGLSQEEYTKVAQIARDYDSSLQTLRERQLAVAKAFREANFPYGHTSVDMSVSAVPAELTDIKARMDSLTIAARDNVHTSLGEIRFTHLHTAVMERAVQVGSVDWMKQHPIVEGAH